MDLDKFLRIEGLIVDTYLALAKDAYNEDNKSHKIHKHQLKRLVSIERSFINIVKEEESLEFWRKVVQQINQMIDSNKNSEKEKLFFKFLVERLNEHIVKASPFSNDMSFALAGDINSMSMAIVKEMLNDHENKDRKELLFQIYYSLINTTASIERKFLRSDREILPSSSLEELGENPNNRVLYTMFNALSKDEMLMNNLKNSITGLLNSLRKHDKDGRLAAFGLILHESLIRAMLVFSDDNIIASLKKETRNCTLEEKLYLAKIFDCRDSDILLYEKYLEKTNENYRKFLRVETLIISLYLQMAEYHANENDRALEICKHQLERLIKLEEYYLTFQSVPVRMIFDNESLKEFINYDDKKYSDAICNGVKDRLISISHRIEEAKNEDYLDYITEITRTDMEKKVLIILNQEIEKEKDPEKKRLLLDAYYIIISMVQSFERELLYNPFLLDVDSKEICNAKKLNPTAYEIIMSDAERRNSNIIIHYITQIITFTEEQKNNYNIIVHITLLKMRIRGLLTMISEKSFQELKAHVISELDDYEGLPQKTYDSILDLFSYRKKDQGISKVYAFPGSAQN